MNATHGCDVVGQIMGSLEAWVKSMVADLDRMEAAELEQRVRREGIEQLSEVFAKLAQSKIDRHPDQNPCSCGGRMHHGGRRERELLTSMGPVRLNGVYRRCRACGNCVHPVESSPSPNLDRDPDTRVYTVAQRAAPTKCCLTPQTGNAPLTSY